ncbi:20S cyclosome subunit (tetratricopeptide) [Phlyctema vagabunda]|uniref:20S cyclosome subunit (Tetratricopeptide) n=1 Tax=Phlyctema vagabunda TaxID=108571 RepID=A0ABR4PPK5_9HELO
MAPSANSIVTNQLRQLIHYHIDNNLLENALFFAERLVAIDPRSSESSYLLALCSFRLGDNASAYEHGKSCGSRGSHLGCAYIFAQACLALKRFKEGISALEKGRGLWGGKNSFGKHTAFSRHPSPDAAAISCLLGKLYLGYDDKKKAITYFEEALKLNPFMWDAFTTLCDMGASVRVPNIFKMSPEMEAVLRTIPQDQWESCQQTKEASHTGTLEHVQNRPTRPPPVVNDSVDPFNNVPAKGFGGSLFSTLGMTRLNESHPSLSNLQPPVNGNTTLTTTVETPTGPPSVDISAAPSRRDPGVVSAYPIEPPQAPVRKNRTLQGLGMDFGMDAPKMSRGSSRRAQKATEVAEDSAATRALRGHDLAPPAGERKRTVSGQVVQPRQTSEDPGAPQRRSVRLFNQIRPTSSKSSSNPIATVGPAPGREVKKPRPPISRIMRPNTGASTVGRVVSGNRKPVEQPQLESMEIDEREMNPRQMNPAIQRQKSLELEASKQEDAVRWLLDLFRKLGSGYFALSQYQCQEALSIYGALPRNQQETPWVLAQIGRAHYEQANYADAEIYYRRVRQIAPTRLDDMELYSTILWHLKRDTDLSFLAHELVDSSWQSPQAWCALGNAWSLSRDHESALKCFKRATQLDSKFAYAYTLMGHEHVENEEYDKALTAYRQGMAADNRHYHAYYGIGRVYSKLGSHDKAICHFKAASVINLTNAVLICCIGGVLEKQRQPKEALKYFTKATELAPKSPEARFKKARALMALGEMDLALKELMILKDLAPDYAMVHFLLGRLYKGMRNKGAAVRHFTIALNLDPKASQKIKEAIESLEDDEDDEEVSMM